MNCVQEERKILDGSLGFAAGVRNYVVMCVSLVPRLLEGGECLVNHCTCMRQPYMFHKLLSTHPTYLAMHVYSGIGACVRAVITSCLLYTSDAADE